MLGIVLRRAEELASLSEELQRSNKELEAFSYSVSHDLRAPFRHIVGYSELLRSREGSRLSEKGRHYINTIIEAAFSAGTLVDNLLRFSQMGRNALNPVAGDLNALVEEVRRAVHARCPGRADDPLDDRTARTGQRRSGDAAARDRESALERDQVHPRSGGDRDRDRSSRWSER